MEVIRDASVRLAFVENFVNPSYGDRHVRLSKNMLAIFFVVVRYEDNAVRARVSEQALP